VKKARKATAAAAARAAAGPTTRRGAPAFKKANGASSSARLDKRQTRHMISHDLLRR
jgi:hypothetical protein